jgi:GNAT superfamily N-acetyltransferase
METVSAGSTRTTSVSSVRLRHATAADEPFLFTVGSSLWQAEAAAMPDPRLVDHFLRIQHTVLETRFQQRFPGHQRFVIERDDTGVGRLYLHRATSMLHLVDLTLLPEARGRGTAGQVLAGILEEARGTGRQVSLRIRRDSTTAAALATELGFGLVTVDDLDQCFTWDPATAGPPPTSG